MVSAEYALGLQTGKTASAECELGGQIKTVLIDYASGCPIGWDFERK